MSNFGYVLAIIALGFLIAIHEAGHMMVARWCGMRVLRYSVGFGKVLWKKTKGETTYQLAMIPFGGFVEIDGMNPVEEHKDPDDPRLFDNRSVWARMAVIVAGPATNFLFAFIFAALLFGSLGQPRYVSKSGLILRKIEKGKPAERAGLKSGDIITHVDGYPLETTGAYFDVLTVWQLGYRYEPDAQKRAALKQTALKVRRGDRVMTVRQPMDPKTRLFGVMLVQVKKDKGLRVDELKSGLAKKARHGLRRGDVILAANGRSIEDIKALHSVNKWGFEGFRWAGKDRREVRLTFRRKGDVLQRDVSPNRHTGKMGAVLAQRHQLTWKRKSFGTDFWAGLTFPVRQSGRMLEGLRRLIGGDKKVREGAAGPVGIVAHMKREMVRGPDHALLIIIILSTLLGLFNLLPVPALDGGRLVFLLVAAVTRRRVNAHVESIIHTVAFFLLLALIALLTYNDLKRLLF